MKVFLLAVGSYSLLRAFHANVDVENDGCDDTQH